MNVNDRPPNFRNPETGKLYLVRCYECNEQKGRENYLPAVASGVCVWCGWTEEPLLPGIEVPQEPICSKNLGQKKGVFGND